MSVLVVALSSCLAVVPVPEPLTPDGSPASPFLFLSDLQGGSSLPSIRVLGGYRPLSRTDERLVHLSFASLGMAVPLGSSFVVESSARMRVIHGAPSQTTPDRLAARVHFLPSVLRSGAIGVGFSLEGSYGADLKGDPPRPGVFTSTMLVHVSGRASALRWSLELGPGLGYRAVSTAVYQAGSRNLVTGGAGMAMDWGAGVQTFVEARGFQRPGLAQPMGVASLGARFPISYNADILVSAVATYDERQRVYPGVALALSGTVGIGDRDEDGFADDVDVCPGISGSPEYQGCVLEDEDQDGVWDAWDACLEEVGPAGNAGCPWQGERS